MMDLTPLPYQLIDQLMKVAGEPAASSDIEFDGCDPIFSTPLRIGDLGAATIGAAAVQAARLWQLRTGRRQRVSVPVDAAAIAMRASRYIRPDPAPEAPRRLGAGGGPGVFQTRDGRWVYFQRLFEHHRSRLSGVLGCPDDNESIKSAVAGWDGLELEEAVVAAGASAALVRSHDEWAAHDQAKALISLPLFEVLELGDSPAETLPPGDRPLAGINVLDVTRVLAGPTCGRTLAEHGANVLRVGTPLYPDNELMMRDTGHGKKSCVLDLASKQGRSRLEELLQDADVFVQGYRPGALASLGFSPERVAELRPGIVYVTLSAWGHEGPWSSRRGFDSVVQAASGIADELAVEGVPRFAPANPLDYATGYIAAFAAMVALARRARQGGSYLVRVSLAQTGRWLASIPRVPAQLLAERPTELPAARMDELMISRDTPFGRLRYFAPAARLSETPGRWELPTVPLDNDPPEWW